MDKAEPNQICFVFLWEVNAGGGDVSFVICIFSGVNVSHHYAEKIDTAQIIIAFG